MSTFDFKSATPVTTPLPSSAFLFGANAQSDSTPQIYAATVLPLLGTANTFTAGQTIQEAVGSSALTLTGATQTTSQPVINATQTWNNAGTTFTGLKLNITNTASANGSKLLDLLIGGTSYFQVANNSGSSSTKIVAFGSTDFVCNASGTNQGINFYGGTAYDQGAGVTVTGNANSASPNRISFWRFGFFASAAFDVNGNFIEVGDKSIGFSSTTGDTTSNLAAADTILTRAAAASLRLGAADAASPVAQTLQVQSATGSNTSAVDWTKQGSLSTGTGTSGNQVYKTGFSGVTQSAVSVTCTSATPAVVTLTAHGFVPGQPFQFGGVTAPTGTALNTTYYVLASGLTVNTFQFALTLANYIAGTAAATSSTGTSLTLTTQASVQNPSAAVMTIGPSGLTGSQTTSLLNLQQTWNTSGVVTGIKANFTNIASSGSSLVLDVQVNSSSVFSINRAGAITMAGGQNLNNSGTIIANRYTAAVPASFGFQFNGQGEMVSPSDGVFLFYNSAKTDFGRLQLGGTTASFPALKRSTTFVQARLADDSAFANIQGKLTADNAYTATPPTCTGYITMYDSTNTAYKVMVST